MLSLNRIVYFVMIIFCCTTTQYIIHKPRPMLLKVLANLLRISFFNLLVYHRDIIAYCLY